MALGATVLSKTQGTSATGQFRTNGWATSEWQTVIDATGVDATADASPILTPSASITRSTRHVFSRPPGCGTYLRLRLKYDDGITGPTSPVVKVFGRTISTAGPDAPSGTAGPWQILRNVAGNLNATLSIDLPNDAQDGEFSYTTPTANDHSWDVDGCGEFLVGIETALSATGTVNTATIEAKFV